MSLRLPSQTLVRRHPSGLVRSGARQFGCAELRFDHTQKAAVGKGENLTRPERSKALAIRIDRHELHGSVHREPAVSGAGA